MMNLKILHPDSKVSELLNIVGEIQKRKDKRPAAAFYFKQVKKND